MKTLSREKIAFYLRIEGKILDIAEDIQNQKEVLEPEVSFIRALREIASDIRTYVIDNS